MKAVKRIVSLILALALLFALGGCQKKEPPIPGDKVAVVVFDLMMKNDATSAMELFGYSTEEEAREDLGIDFDLYSELADEMVSQFETMGLSATSEQVEDFVNAFIAMFKDVEFSAVVKESDEKNKTAVVTCTVSTFDPNALNDAMMAVVEEMSADPNLDTSDTDALMVTVLTKVVEAISQIKPMGEKAEFDADFALETVEIKGEEREIWFPADPEQFGLDLSTTVMGG